MAGFDELSKNLKKHGDTILVNLNRKTKRVALAIDALIVKAMPVDTGRAKSSVVVTLNNPSPYETKEAYFPGEKGSTEGQNIRAATEQAKIAIHSRELEEEIHININIPYIDDLNKGHSPLAAPGFIETAVEEGVRSQRDLPILKSK
ncbi:hypothetical protein [Nitrosomonas ureae]|uniref:Uncharacterized protein n=1 Tax=Nitrosomonas ureae TaxID=44577 RepID=A0A286ABV4_9PROT|nr:hypothetical protein [Nitrosomonas ureae]SOD19379.1 hypothetical protein SAMN06297164_2364 [Nitrosomonas ureae]